MSAFPTIYSPLSLFPYYGWGPLLPQRVDADKVPPPAAPTGQPQTGDQNLGSVFGIGSSDAWLSGFADAPPGGYRVWRLIAKEPTVVLANALVIGPILSGTRCVEVRRKPGQAKKRKGGALVGDGIISDPLDKRAEFVDGVLSPLLHEFIADMATSLILAHKPFEVVWDVKGGMDVITEFRPLRNEATQLIVENRTGKFLGLKHNNVDIFGPDAFNFANETEDGYQGGKSRAEYCREHWWFALQQWRKLGELAQKAVGISMAIGGPVGTGQKDSAGNAIDGKVAANTMAIEMIKQRPVFYPRNPLLLDPEKIADPEYAKSWAILNDSKRWTFDQFDWGDTAPAAMAIIAQLDKLDVKMMRAFSRPEREAMEGQHGTKAEAGTHGQVGVTDSDLRHIAYCRAISRGPINDLLQRNFGVDARDSVYLEASPIQDAQKQFLSQLLTDSLTNPQNSQDFYGKVDKAKVADDLDIPMREGIDANEEPKPIVPPPALGAPKDANGSANGNGRMNGNGVKMSREDDGILNLLSHWSDGEGTPVEVGGRFSREDAPPVPDIVVNMPAQAVAAKVTKRITFDKDGDGKILGGTVTEETEDGD